MQGFIQEAVNKCRVSYRIINKGKQLINAGFHTG